MPPKSDGDARQRDFFGVPKAEPKPPTTKPVKVLLATARPPADHRADKEAIEGYGLHDRIARLSPAELRELTATLTDDGLAQLTLATIRQLKRRLARESRYGNKGQRSPLKRAAEQLVAEFSGQGEEDDF